MKKAYAAGAVRCKIARDTLERLFGLQTLGFSDVGELSAWIGVRIADVMEVGQVEYLAESVLARDFPGQVPFCLGDPGKGNRKSSVTLDPVPNRLFEFGDDSIVLLGGRGFDEPSFKVGLKKQEEQ